MAKSQSLMEWATKANKWARGLAKQLLVPTTLAAVATAILSGFLIVAMFFNSWNGSLQAINEALETENDRLRERSAGLLEETLFRVDTLATTVSKTHGDRVSLNYRPEILLQGNRIVFEFHRYNVRLSEFAIDNLVTMKFFNSVDGMPLILAGKPADDAHALTNKVETSMELGKGCFFFTALGRKYYLYCERLYDDPDSLTIVTTIMALDPIYRPTLGL